MYIKITDGTPENYTISQLRRDNPNVSFSEVIPTEKLASFGVYPVKVLPRPNYDDYDANTHRIVLSNFYQVDGKWQAHYLLEPLPESQAAENIRAYRNSLLKETDWRFRVDMTPSQEWIDYCQALRDITAQEGFPYDIIWPAKPV